MNYANYGISKAFKELIDKIMKRSQLELEFELVKEQEMKNQPPKTPKIYRQGDVLLIEVFETLEERAIPLNAIKIEGTTIALGEVTGHHHTFESQEVEVMEMGDLKWVVATEVAPLTHQEHATIMVDPGTYEVRIQREYEPTLEDKSRPVWD